MNLGSLEREEVSGWVRFEDKFDVLVVCTSKDELRKRIDRCKKTTYVKHQPTETIDEELLRKELAKCISGWRGLTLGIVATMIPYKINDADKDIEIECNKENKLALLKDAYYFDTFIQNASTDFAMLKQEQARKN